MTSPKTTLVTPAHRRDLGRFLMQRESIERCGIDLPHVVVVDHEDLPRFRDLAFQRKLTLVSTRDVLPRPIEARRVAYHLRRRDPWRWVVRGKPLHGWGVQQFVKLAAPAVVSTERYVCLDADTLFVGRVTATDFADPRTGMPYLYETADDVDAEMAEWVGRSMRFLGVKPTHQPVTRYTHSPVVMRRDVVLDMQKFIERRHGLGWIDAMDRFGMIMEYSTYGVFAKYVDGAARVVPARPALSLYYWWAEEVACLTETLSRRVRETGAKILAIQSNTGLAVADYRHLLDEIWSGQVGQPA